MLIRSQNKKYIVNLNVIDTIIATRDNVIRAFRGSSTTDIGEYSTEEKAIKVLDMIQDAYKSTMNMSISADTGISCIPVPVVFQMPQDSEV